MELKLHNIICIHLDVHMIIEYVPVIINNLKIWFDIFQIFKGIEVLENNSWLFFLWSISNGCLADEDFAWSVSVHVWNAESRHEQRSACLNQQRRARLSLRNQKWHSSASHLGTCGRWEFNASLSFKRTANSCLYNNQIVDK